MKNRIVLLAALLAAGLTSSVFAEEGAPKKKGPQPLPEFSKVDADGDGIVIQKEMKEANARVGEKLMQKVDADGDGKLTEAEYNQAVEITNKRIANAGKN